MRPSRNIDAATNYHEYPEPGDPKHVCGPYLSLSDEEVQDEGKTIGGEWPGIEAEVREVVARHPGVTLRGTDLDEVCNIGFLDLASEDDEPLIACLSELSRMGFATGLF